MRRLAYLLTLIGFAGLLTACPQTKKIEPTFTLRLEPAALTVRVTETAAVSVIINRSGAFTEAVTVSLTGDTAGLEAEPVTITHDEGTLAIRVTDAAGLGTSFLSVKAEGGKVIRTETLTLHVEKAVASATEVTREGEGSRQVRQGFGEVTLVVTGKNLERTTGIKVGGLEFKAKERTAARLELAVAIPHGASPGTKDLVLSAEGGDTTFAGALEVTPVTAGPTGDDATGAGTLERPYRTLTHALTKSAAGDTVLLLEGTYSEGEVWPVVGAAVDPNVPSGVRVAGQNAGGTVLKGPGVATPLMGLAFAGDGEAADLTVTGFTLGMLVAAGEVGIERLTFRENGVGLEAIGGKVTVADGEFTTSTESGVRATGEAALELSGGSALHNDGDGVWLGDGAPSLRAVSFAAHHNRSGIAAAGRAGVTLERSRLHDNIVHGLEILGEASAMVASSDLYANGQGGVWSGGNILTLRGVTVRENSGFGVYVTGAPERVDLGTFTTPGENDLYGNGPNGTSGHLLDVRPVRPTLEVPIIFTVSATRIGGALPEPDVYPPDNRWPYFDDLGFSILEANNVVQIF